MQHISEFFRPIMPIWHNYIKPVTSETIRILPDSLLFGSGLLSILTFSPAHFVFFLSIIEFAFIQSIIASTLLSSSPSTFEMKNSPLSCSTGYKPGSLYQLSIMRIMKESYVPNPLIFMLSAASFYFYAMYLNFNTDYSSLGQEMISRVGLSIILSGLLILAIIIWRSFVDKCESSFALLISCIIGLVGMGVFYQNLNLFGPDLVNMNSIPLLQVTPVCS